MTSFPSLLVASVLALTAATASASAAGPTAKPAPEPRKLVLEEFFRGPLLAEGEFLNTRDGTRRGVKVKMNGQWDGTTLTLVEDFVYSDGEKDRKTWRFTKTGEGRYVGVREDVIGQAAVMQVGNDVKLDYKATVRTKDGGSYGITFADVLTQTGPRTVLNTAKLSWLFFDVGTVRLDIHKPGRR
jgi:hypothetical protein